jgi:hypothetical protein
MHHPAFDFHQPADLLAIDQLALSIPQQRPHAAVTISGVLKDQLMNALDQPRINLRLSRVWAVTVERTAR